MGNNVTYDNAIFRYNTAVNGSALFVDGVASLKNIVFYRNQAYTYALPIIVQNPKNPYGVTVNVTVVIIGGNNIANAIHHVGQLNDISFDNVTYLFNVNGTIMNRTTGADELHPVDGVENSKNGTLIYRDERENTQSINPIVIYDEDGNIIYNETLISSIYGDVRFSLSGLAPGNYTIKAEHPEDLFYKAIKNETNFEVVGFVDLDVGITTDKNYYGLDEEVEWTISLTNHGPHTDNYCYVNGIKLDDIVGFTPSKGTFDAATGVWNVGKLAKNEAVTLKVKTKTTSLGTITLTVNAVNSTEDTNISNNVATKTIYIQELPKVVPTKDVNITNPNYGDKVKYTIVVSNVGKITADVTLTDTLDEGLIFTGASGNYEYDSTTRTVTWNIDGLAVGQNLTFYVYATVDAYGVLNNTVTVGDNMVIRNVTVPEITPDKTIDNDSPNFGDKVTYTVTVTNGGFEANNVVVKDVVGEGLTVTGISDNGQYDPVTRTITWIVDLAKNEVKTFTVEATVSGYGNISNKVVVGNKTIFKNIDVPEITPKKDVNNTTPNFGENVAYTIVVSNDGITDAKQVVVTDTLAKGLKFIGANYNGVYDESTHTVTWILDINAKDKVTLNVTAAVDAYGVLNNNVTIGDKTSSVDITVPEIIPDKTANTTNTNYGDDVTYSVIVTNDGDVDAKDVIIVDQLGSDLKYVSSSDGGVWDEKTNTVTWIVDLSKGETKTFTVVATVVGYGNVTNSLTVGNKTSKINVTVPEITPDKTVDNENPNFGDNVTYTIVVTNNGVVDAKQVVVRDILDKGLKFVKATGEYTFDEDSRTVTWIVDLAKGESQTFYVTAVAEAYGVLTNDVTVGDNTASADVVVPEINPDKIANITNPNFGDKVDYTVTVTNDGIGDANNVVIVDRLGEGLTFVSASDNGVWDPVKRTVTWIVDLAKGESKVFSVIATVSGYGNVTNSLVVGNKTAGVNVTVPEINPDKTANISNPNFGDNVNYTVTVTNDGIGDAKDVVVRDVLGEGLKFVSATGEYTWDEDSRTVTWIVDLAKGESRTFYVDAIVSGYGNVTNSLIVGNKTISVNVTVPEIIPDKTVGIENPNFGDTVTYTVTVTNDGIGDANDVVVRDILGEGLTFVDATGNYTFDKDSRTVTWIVDLAKGESRTFYVNAIVSGYGNVTNYLVVGNKTAGVNVTVPEINPDKTANISNPNFGDNVNYTVTVTNDGIGDAKDVVVRDVLGEGLKFVSATGNYTFDEATRTVTWTVDLAKGESKVFSVIATVVGYGNVTNSLVVGNKTTGVNVTVPEINPDKTVDNEIPNFGDNVTYTVTVTNDGIGDANNVVITDVLDKGLKFLNATENFTYDEKTGTITWTVDLDKGETKTFNVNVTVLGYGVLSNTVAVGNKTAVRNITVPEIITVKEVNSSDIHIGDEITYTITVSNPGKINATNVVIRDILPEGLKFINASNGGVYDPVTGIITWILNITANSTVDLTADVCVNKSGNITNTVNVGNKTSNCTIESGDIVDLEIHIVADKSEIYVGDNVVYTVTVINNGPSDAINTIANILIPNTLSILSYNATKGTFDITSGNWSIGNLTNGEKVVLTFVAKALNEGNSTVYVNVTSETFEVTMENNYDNVTVKVLKKAAPIGPDKPVHPDGSSSDNEGKGSVNLPNTGNPLVMLLLCILSVIFVGSRKRKL